MKKLLLLLIVAASLLHGAKSAIEFLPNKRVAVSYGLNLTGQPTDSTLTSTLQQISFSVFSYGDANTFYFGYVIDAYSGIKATDSFLQLDNAFLVGYMFGDNYTANMGYGVSTIGGSDPSAMFTMNLSTFFLDIATMGLKLSAYLSSDRTSALYVAIVTGLTF
ncbi:MAG: hypothetical protein KU37_04590 [Sulfuricurvum sp. PC08-66]|nr:MAG: hypothetical protein KU37_04590 [Sulfuricurvum sp. PC08-66]